MHHLAEMFQSAASTQDYVRRYTQRLSKILAEIDADAVAAIIDTFDRASRQGRRLFFIANGGSAAIASHWVNDLVAGAYVEGGPNFRALCLSDNVSSVTALGNDAGYDNVFVRQLEVHLEPEDVVFAMSVSGNSENIIRAVDFAKSRGARTIGVCGFGGGRLKDRCEITLHVPATPDEYGPVEDVFAILDHIVTGYLTMRRGKALHH